jgi:23S rRNA pseudouridine1911/1915/1917 synthase
MPLILEYIACIKDNNKSLGNFLKQQDLSRRAIVALKHRGGKIFVNTEVQTTRFKLHVGDVVTVTFPDEPVSNALLPHKMEFKIIYEDEYLLVVDKEAGLPSVPAGTHSVSLANGILAYYEQIGLKSTVHFVNRLDKDTSGLLVVAKYRHIHHLMTENIKAVSRKYYALVSGVLKDFGVIDAPIFRPSADSVKRIVHPSGKRAITNCEVLMQIEGSTLVRCTLETGRTHQIRVHMAHIGHPILKDSLYGDGEAGEMQLLHSYFLEFTHPMTGEALTFETEVPSRFGLRE